MSELKGTIGRWQGVGMITTSLLGTSVFILPQVTVDMAASAALWAWILLVIAILPLALVFAELGKRFPNAGGPSHFVSLAFNRRLGASIGLLFLFAAPVGTPAALMITFEFIKPLIALTDTELLMAQLGALAFLFVINVRGLKLSSVLQLTLTLAIVAITLSLLWGNELHLPADLNSQLEAPSPSLWSAFAIALWAYLGIEIVSHLSEEFKRPERDFVPAMVIATVLVAAIYLVSTAMVLGLPKDHGAGLAMVALFDQQFGDGGALVIGVLGTAAGLATVNTYLSGMSRLMWRLAQEGQLPSQLGRLNRHRVPTLGLGILLIVVAIALVFTHLSGLNFEPLLEWCNGLFVLIYLCSMLAGYKLLSKRFRVKALLGIGACALFALSLGSAMIYGMIIFAAAWLWQSKANQQQTANESN
ncbi:L-methionine/branched-chain amino acid transporter [Ferrimonas aestuarii]|uniref:L-methionine/branched-chain amino acid transporter n=1 Tax=Ferrimonas aestuarii TaxID=2569539 RepID=A0A4U1BSN6_9GAMM|nr:L-methionine/branched-chain amino acid transporter [Ferrimonas aestuarii]TKB56637.1 L-methionine/branched-chain amino acid transporter [Ferrimonas aestuarii]